MPPPNLTEALTTAINNYSSTLADNVLNNNALLYALKEGRADKMIKFCDGGTRIQEDLMYAETRAAGAYDGYDVLSVNSGEVLTAAEYDWKQYYTNVVMSGREQFINMGDSRQHDLLEARLKVAEKTMCNMIGADLYDDGTGRGGKAITGLRAAVSDTPDLGVYGGIDAAVNDGSPETLDWRNQVVEDAAVTIDNITQQMSKLSRSLVRGRDVPNIYIADFNFFGLYEDALVRFRQITSDKEADAGFQTLRYKGKPIYYDENCPDDHLYALNGDYLHWRPHRQRNFVAATERFAVNQDAAVMPVYWMGNMTCSNRSLQGVLLNP